MKEEMQKKLFCKIVLITFFVAECTFKKLGTKFDVRNISCKLLKYRTRSE